MRFPPIAREALIGRAEPLRNENHADSAHTGAAGQAHRVRGEIPLK
jgi:hypothetical protein